MPFIYDSFCWTNPCSVASIFVFVFKLSIGKHITYPNIKYIVFRGGDATYQDTLAPDYFQTS